MEISGSAEFSPCGQYRYRLDRWWGDGPTLLVCMANPSTAGADRNDPTITNLIKLAAAQGYGRLTVVNWHPRIATDPKDLASWRWYNPMKSAAAEAENLERIRGAMAGDVDVVAAWGNMGPPLCHYRTRLITLLSRDLTAIIWCFATTKSGNPTHPLARGKARLKIGAPLEIWRDAL